MLTPIVFEGDDYQTEKCVIGAKTTGEQPQVSDYLKGASPEKSCKDNSDKIMQPKRNKRKVSNKN